MSRKIVELRKILSLLLLLSGSIAPPAQAAQTLDTLKNEIVYRTDLGRADDVELLLKQGASPDEKNPAGTPLLALAAARIDPESANIVRVLLDAGANINAKDAQGRNALFYAGKNDNLAVVKYLLSKGIKYYDTDNNGDIARTIAFRAGHQDIVNAMDDFVKGQSEEVKRQYDAFNEAVKQRNEQVRKQEEAVMAQAAAEKAAPAAPSVAEKAEQEAKEKKAQEEAALAAAQKAKEEAEKAAQKAKEQAEQAEKEAARAKAESQGLYKELSFHNCAFEYWSYCSSARQSTEMSADELDLAIHSLKAKIVTLDDQLIKNHNTEEQIANVADSAKKRIFNELNAMPSNSYRHEFGIGKMDDMQTRCDRIAEDWDTPPPANLASPPKSSGGGGGIGATGMGGGAKSPAAGGGHAPQPYLPIPSQSPSARGGMMGMGGGHKRR